MQVDSLMMSNKWAAGRVPPLDLTDHSLCTRETELQWQHSTHPSQSSESAAANRNNHLRSHTIYQEQYETNYQHQPTKRVPNQTNLKFDIVIGSDGLPIGMLANIILYIYISRVVQYITICICRSA